MTRKLEIIIAVIFTFWSVGCSSSKYTSARELGSQKIDNISLKDSTTIIFNQPVTLMYDKDGDELSIITDQNIQIKKINFNDLNTINSKTFSKDDLIKATRNSNALRIFHFLSLIFLF